MRRLLGLVLAVAAPVVAGCSQTPITLPLRSLESSGDMSFVCVGTGPDGRPQGKDLNDCPDYANGINHLIALVTQPNRGEVAVVDLTAGNVLDTDPSTPGFNFLPVGANPVHIVSTPGGEASFVGVAAVGKQGIFALPSSCLGPPRQTADGGTETVRDLTSWTACALPSAPGAMAVLVDPEVGGAERASCDAPSYTVEAATPGTAPAATRSQCAADLALETNPPGRRKLAVAMPDIGKIAIIDAQQLLDQTPGEFPACTIERLVSPAVALPSSGAVQRVPADLQAPGCGLGAEVNYGPVKQSFLSRPADFPISKDTLYVADQGAPVVHVFDVHDPCKIVEQPPLLPVSFESPGRTVTTTKVAVSPMTTTGKQFVYAVDQFGSPPSIMVFDVSPGSSDRTPIVRPGSPRLPFEAADRIAFSATVQDVEFALKDNPIPDPATGVAVVGAECNPDPAADNSVNALYRPSSDLSSGAAPRVLRGVFGLALLKTGQVVVIDEQDFDAPCRRPESGNTSSEPDYRGCSGDALATYSSGGEPTVSNEASCNIVEPHRTRSGNYVLTTPGIGAAAPTLRSLPRLHAATGGSAAPDDPANPKLLAVDFAAPGTSPPTAAPTEVYVGTDKYSTAPDAENLVDTDPKTAQNESIVLPLQEPRAFGPQEDFTLTYEGTLFDKSRTTGVLNLSASDATQASLVDPDAYFCNIGVQDQDMARQVGGDLAVASADLDDFASSHADRLEITGARLASDDSYWRSTAAAACGGAANGPYNCDALFGTPDLPTTARDLRVVEAWSDHLVVTPAQAGVTLGNVQCCFPEAESYTIRGGAQWILRGAAFRHHVRVSQSGRCEFDCNPRRALLKGRAFEVPDIFCHSVPDGKGGETQDCRPIACNETKGAKITDPSSPCIFNSISARFAVYAGTAPTVRDTNFTWTVTGGFVPLVANIASQTASVLPQSMTFIPQIGQLAVADGASAGLVLISLDTVSVSHLYF